MNIETYVKDWIFTVHLHYYSSKKIDFQAALQRHFPVDLIDKTFLDAIMLRNKKENAFDI